MNKLAKIITLIFIGIFSLSLLVPIHRTYAADICTASGVGQEMKDAAGCGDKDRDITPLITTILNTVIGITGIIAVIFVIIGGINYMTSAGDAGKVKKARDTILYACIGLVICALSFAIVNWVISGVSGQSGGTSGGNTESTN